MCAPGNSFLLSDFSVTRQTFPIHPPHPPYWFPPKLSLTQKLIKSSVPWLGLRAQAGWSASLPLLFPLHPFALLPFPAGGCFAIMEPSSTALLWQHQCTLTVGRGDVFITFPGDYLFKHFSDSYNNKSSVLCFPAEGHLLLKDV